ncbi:MAG: peptidylprolyl isomerase [Phycisphaerae bacterium]|nr:peptidylprolyl isomerase [Phycisphaerae bacterium]
MKRTTLWRTGLCLLAVVAAPGCEMDARRTTVEPRQPVQSPEAPHSEAASVLARVNGRAIPMDALYDALLRDNGLRVAQQLIADELVRQELQARGLPANVTDRDREIENRRALTKVFQFDETPTPEQLDGLLNQLLAQKNITRRTWDATMTRNVLLTRLAEHDPRVDVTDEDIRRAFFEEYDGKLKVRHVQAPTMVIAQEVTEKARDGEDFAQLAFQYSTNPSGKTGGWLPDIGPRTAPETVPPPIIQAARALKKPGDVSNIVQVGSNFHVLKLEEIVPPEKVKFSDVKGKLRFIVRDKKIDRLQPVIMKELINKAQIEYVDPVIRSRVRRGATS